MSTNNSQDKRFAIAVSFPGEHRRFVRNVVARLAEKFGRDRVFYDEWYQPELLGLDGDLKLRRYYREQSELVVPFFSEHYEKDWCKIEWSAIRAMLKARRKENAVIPVQMDGTKVDGWEETDFAIRRGNRTGKQVADLILAAYLHRHPGTGKPETETALTVTDSEPGEKLPVISKFEQQVINQTTLEDLDRDLINLLLPKIAGFSPKDLDENLLYKELAKRSYLKRNPNSKSYHATALGLLLFGIDPSRFFLSVGL